MFFQIPPCNLTRDMVYYSQLLREVGKPRRQAARRGKQEIGDAEDEGCGNVGLCCGV